jgi:hypothetical protein
MRDTAAAAGPVSSSVVKAAADTQDTDTAAACHPCVRACVRARGVPGARGRRTITDSTSRASTLTSDISSSSSCSTAPRRRRAVWWCTARARAQAAPVSQPASQRADESGGARGVGCRRGRQSILEIANSGESRFCTTGGVHLQHVSHHDGLDRLHHLGLQPLRGRHNTTRRRLLTADGHPDRHTDTGPASPPLPPPKTAACGGRKAWTSGCQLPAAGCHASCPLPAPAASAPGAAAWLSRAATRSRSPPSSRTCSSDHASRPPICHIAHHEAAGLDRQPSRRERERESEPSSEPSQPAAQEAGLHLIG